jgi:hypothetical protein
LVEGVAEKGRRRVFDADDGGGVAIVFFSSSAVPTRIVAVAAEVDRVTALTAFEVEAVNAEATIMITSTAR